MDVGQLAEWASRILELGGVAVILLGTIVLIRTFLSFSLEVELEGRWPRESRRGSGAGAGA